MHTVKYAFVSHLQVSTIPQCLHQRPWPKNLQGKGLSGYRTLGCDNRLCCAEHKPKVPGQIDEPDGCEGVVAWPRQELHAWCVCRKRRRRKSTIQGDTCMGPRQRQTDRQPGGIIHSRRVSAGVPSYCCCFVCVCVCVNQQLQHCASREPLDQAPEDFPAKTASCSQSAADIVPAACVCAGQSHKRLPGV